jgi:hypothetical protein
MLRRSWRFRRLHVTVGVSDRYGVEATVDVGYGWGLILQLWNVYLLIEWWPFER